jgi:crotonobetainyl-CoA:carnitine CoA-transferase CaiB-like acyl-CoA transferase
LSLEAIKSLVEDVVTTKDRTAQEQHNASIVVSAFAEKYGASAEAEFIKLAQNLQVGVQFLNSMAKASPAALLKLAGLDKEQKVTPPTSTSTDVNTAGFSPQPPAQPRKSVMVGATTKDLVAEWRRTAPKQ